MLGHKDCEWCGATFHKPVKISITQWESRAYCSKKCAGRSITFPRDEMIDLYVSGKSSTEIAFIVGCSSVQVLRVIRSAGVTRSLSDGKILSHNKPDVKEKMRQSKLGTVCPEHVKAILRERIGPKHHSWNGGITHDAAGYLCYTISPANGDNAGKLVHRVVAEKMIGRELLSSEHVHHHDRDKTNNIPSNLAVMTASDHAKLHTPDRNEGLRKWLAQ